MINLSLNKYLWLLVLKNYAKFEVFSKRMLSTLIMFLYDHIIYSTSLDISAPSGDVKICPIVPSNSLNCDCSCCNVASIL